MKKSLLGYKVGLIVLGLFTLGLFGAIVMQSSAAKQDNQTFKAASDIARKLNNYTDTKQHVPVTLAQAGVEKVPASISYRTTGTTSYEFCVTYKKASNNINASTVVQDVVWRGMRGTSTYPGSDGAYPNYALYLNSDHHKGKNCQTVKLYSFDSMSSDITNTTTSQDPSQYYTN